jgi:hypothetical protein
MRPRKRILVWGKDELTAIDFAYPLGLPLWYKPLPCWMLDAVDLALKEGVVMAVVISDGKDGASTVCERIATKAPHIRILAICDSFVSYANTLKPGIGRGLIFDAIRTMSARKRGPRRKPVQPERGGELDRAISCASEETKR